jgi:hypothetical protein
MLARQFRKQHHAREEKTNVHRLCDNVNRKLDGHQSEDEK